MNRVCILGSLNMDIVIKVNSMPKVGETIIGSGLVNIPGGKGANQAVAARRSGADVFMVGKVGSDSNGEKLVKEMESNTINVDYIFKDKNKPTGTAIITVDEQGNNSITVVPGANMAMTEGELSKAKEIIRTCNVLVSQFETALHITLETFKYAKECGIITILNPAPAKSIPEEFFKYIDLIVPNETEALELTNIKVEDLMTAKEAAEFFLKRGVKYVIITLGDKGAALISDMQCEIIPAYKVIAVDTTAAGDSFIGAIASMIDSSKISFENIKTAIIFGNKVSSIAVQKEGAQPSIPTLKEVMEIYKED